MTTKIGSSVVTDRRSGKLIADHPLLDTHMGYGASEALTMFEPVGDPEVMEVDVYDRGETTTMLLPVYAYDGARGFILLSDVAQKESEG